MSNGRSLSEQLRPLAEARRTPRQFPIAHVMAEIAGEDAEASVDAARTQVLRWLQNRSGTLPRAAWENQSFEKPNPVAQSAAVRLLIDDFDYWSARLDYQDDTVAGRTWTTEIGIARGPAAPTPMFGLRHSVTTRETEPQFELFLPGVVRQVAESPGLIRNGRLLSEEPWLVSTEEPVDELVELIEDPNRLRPIYAISLPEGETDPAVAIIDARHLAVRCLAIAHIAVITGPATYWLTDRLNRPFSVFHSAVRTYRPGFDQIADSPFDHPLALPKAISEWEGIGPKAFSEMLVARAASESVRRIRGDQELPSFSFVRQADLRLRREQSRADVDGMLTLADEQLEELAREKKEGDELLAAQDQELENAAAQINDLESQNAFLRARIDQLEQQLREASGQQVDARVPIPESLDDLRDWAEQHLAGRILVTGKAARAAKNAAFEDVGLAYKAVLLMANEYRQMRLSGEPAAREAYENKLNGLGLSDTTTGEETKLREQGDEFLVAHGNRKRLLDRHLKNQGNTRNPARCFRLYYFWDDETQQVVIGSMPGHLHTRQT